MKFAARDHSGARRFGDDDEEAFFCREDCRCIEAGQDRGACSRGDQYTRECLKLHADTALTGEKVATDLDDVIASRSVPQSITVDNGTEFASQAIDVWAYTH